MIKKVQAFLLAVVVLSANLLFIAIPAEAKIMQQTDEQITEFYLNVEDNEIINTMVSAGAIYNQRFEQAINPFNYTPLTLNAIKESRQTALAGPSWSINNKEDLEQTLAWIIIEGHNSDFMYIAELLDGLSESEYKLLLGQGNDRSNQMLTNVKNIYSEYGNSGILAWDLYRAALLVMWGYEAQYLTKEEAIEWGKPITFILKASFKDWDEANRNYLLGYCYWANENPNDSVSEYKLRVQAWEKVLKEKPHLYDDSFFLQWSPQ